MKARSPWIAFAILSVLLLFGLGVISGLSRLGVERRGILASTMHSPAILSIDLDGVIMDSSKFVEALKKHAEDDNIKAVVIRINSPGGSVGPSQEIYNAIKRVRTELKKPVIATCSAVAASGAYYAAVAADKIFTNPGTLMGSIGVIMEFANLEDLYGWAKIKRYAITTGQYKDSGAEYRAMRPDEKELFHKMLSEVHMQFKKAVAEGRNLQLAEVEKIADGRVVTGESAVKLKLADSVGDYEDALREAWKMAGLEGKPEVYKPRKPENILKMILTGGEDEESKSPAQLFKALRMKLVGQPLFLMPGWLDMTLSGP